jgi:hypothetical protein
MSMDKQLNKHAVGLNNRRAFDVFNKFMTEEFWRGFDCNNATKSITHQHHELLLAT